jgi:hypothetical protein
MQGHFCEEFWAECFWSEFFWRDFKWEFLAGKIAVRFASEIAACKNCFTILEI